MDFAAMRTAWKRAEHFAPIVVAGPFTPLHSPIGRNYMDALDGEHDTVDELVILRQWAEGLNRAADRTRVAADPDLCFAFAAFRQRMPINPTRLP